ncbi:MAG TPA: hypothetical protein DDW90_04775 [Cyanobacteria bacterium UBA9971]|nr:hypothetical protein [Cyanobacteria bacterium UBA9971]
MIGDISCCKNGSFETLYRELIMALHTGMRKGEILNLTWDCVNLERRYLRILNSKSGKPRHIPINEKLANELNRLSRHNNYVFANPETGLPYVDLKKAFKSVKDKAEITGFRFHDLRHTVATRMVANGTDLGVVMEILGHADIKTTMRYAHPVRYTWAYRYKNDLKILTSCA